MFRQGTFPSRGIETFGAYRFILYRPQAWTSF